MRIIALVSLIVMGGVVVSLSVCSPDILAANDFLKGFINQEILNIMAVIMTISMATIATIHIWFNELEKNSGKKVFGGARREINQSAFAFIVLLGIIRLTYHGFLDTFLYRERKDPWPKTNSTFATPSITMMTQPAIT